MTFTQQSCGKQAHTRRNRFFCFGCGGYRTRVFDRSIPSVSRGNELYLNDAVCRICGRWITAELEIQKVENPFDFMECASRDCENKVLYN
ncbi:hypothetical protein NPIL_676331 [Nephila pilipes]|uniref:Uncharacterized protein n=1 Tax=Nephila pilipes TaxID=299642 RepID=A0A8X6T3L7_NEPPI|nr:hypothetical protein NPIL_676331 [Nephila pilipes]